MYFCNKPNYALLKALSLNRCESFNVPIGNCSRKREREDSNEDCISAKVPRLFGAYVPKIVTLPQESSPPLISPSPLPSPTSSPVCSSSPIFSPPLSPILRSSQKCPRKSLFKEENPPFFIVEVLNILLDSLPSVGEEKVGLHNDTKIEEIEETSLARANEDSEENQENASEDHDENIDIEVESIANTDPIEAEILTTFDEGNVEMEIAPVGDLQNTTSEENNVILTSDNSSIEDASSIQVTSDKTSSIEDNTVKVDIDEVLEFYDATINNEFEKDMVVQKVKPTPSTKPTEIVTLDGDQKVSTEDDIEILYESKRLTFIQIVPSTSRAPVVIRSTSEASESIPSRPTPPESVPSSPSIIDLDCTNTSLSSIASISELLESSNESITPDARPSTGRSLFTLDPEGFKVFAKQIALQARVEIQMNPVNLPKVNENPRTTEDVVEVSSPNDEEDIIVQRDEFALIGDTEDEVEQYDEMEVPLRELPIGPEEQFDDEINTEPPRGPPVEGEFAEAVARVVTMKAGSLSAVPTSAHPTYTRIKLMTLTDSLACLIRSLPNEWIYNRELTSLFGFYLVNDSHYTDASIELRRSEPSWWLMCEEDSPAYDLLIQEIDLNIPNLVDYDGAKLKESDVKMFRKLKDIERQQSVNMQGAMAAQSRMVEPSPLFNPPEGQVARFIEALPNILGTRFRRLLPVQIFESHQYFLVICQLEQYSVHVRYHTEYLNAFVMRYGYIREYMSGIGKLRLMVKNACILIEVVDLIISRLQSLTCGMCKNVDSCEEMRGQYCFDLQ